MKFKKEDIDKLTAEDICIEIINYTIELNRQYENDSEEQILNRLNEVERIVHLVTTFEFEYYNGGLLQYFMNSSGAQANEAIKAHRFLGANKTANIIEEALKILYKHSVPPDVLRDKLQNAGELWSVITQADIYDNPDFDKDFEPIEKELNSFYPKDECGEITDALEMYIDSMRDKITE